jgi:CheY-like chemotaxis protein
VITAAPTPLPATHDTKTLFVDEDWSRLSSYRTVIGDELDAEYVASGEEAIARLVSSKPPDIVVCDLVMPFSPALLRSDRRRLRLAERGKGALITLRHRNRVRKPRDGVPIGGYRKLG